MRFGVIVVLLMGLYSACNAADIARVVIRPQAMVQPLQMVRLGDIAQVDACKESAESLKSVEIARAPGPGASREITVSWVRSRIQCAGIDPANTRLIIGETGGLDKAVITGRSQKISGADIAEAARLAVMDQASNGVICTAEVQSRLTDTLVPDGQVELIAQPRTQVGVLKPGRQWVNVKTLVDGAEYTSTLVAVNVKMFGPVLVATQSIRAGDALNDDNTTVEDRELTAQSNALTQLPTSGAMVAGRTINVGTPITASSVTTRPDVHRGDPVLVMVRSRGVKVAVRGTAARDAAAGSTVRVLVPWSKEEILATVVEPGLAEVKLR